MKRLAIILLPLLLVSGCGTFMTRGGDPTFGAYPYQAVENDVVYWIPETFKLKQPDHPIAEGVDLATVIVTVPIDFVVDTVLLPVDIGYWIAGQKKNNKGPEMHFGG